MCNDSGIRERRDKWISGVWAGGDGGADGGQAHQGVAGGDLCVYGGRGRGGGYFSEIESVKVQMAARHTSEWSCAASHPGRA